jgi:hypothetical protein
MYRNNSIFKRIKIMNKLFKASAFVLLSTSSISVFSASITPDSFEATIDVGETVTVTKTITTDVGGASKVDVFFLADNTGSMSGVINNVRNAATAILSGLSAVISDVAFGVARYFGDPKEGGEDFDSAYDVLQPITTVGATAVASMGSWIASGGGDSPEANFYAIQQASTEGANTDGIGSTDPVGGDGTGEATGWRDGAAKILLWFGDVSSHTTTVDELEAIEAAQDNGVTVIAFNSSSAGSGIDSSSQASNVTAATGGSLINNFSSLSGDALTAAVLASIDLATSTFDLDLFTVGDTSGLDVSFSCMSAEGCDDVVGGESREFEMSITGLTSGVYDFDVGVTGISGLFESDLITVRGSTDVPAPATITLLGSALLLLGLRKRKSH